MKKFKELPFKVRKGICISIDFLVIILCFYDIHSLMERGLTSSDMDLLSFEAGAVTVFIAQFFIELIDSITLKDTKSDEH